MSEMIDRLQNASGIYAKANVITHYPSTKALLKRVYGLDNFYVTKETLHKEAHNPMYLNPAISYDTDHDLMLLLEVLNSREVTGHSAIERVARYLNYHSKFYSVILRILDKDLKVGISVKTINRAFPGLIPEFNVPLAKEYDPDKHGVGVCKFISRKLNGIRCLCFIREGQIKFYSRYGREFLTLDKLREDLVANWWSSERDVIIDGELCIIDENGLEDFNRINGEVKMKDHTIASPMLFAIDMYTIEEFEQGYSERRFGATLAHMQEALNQTERVKAHEQRFVEDLNGQLEIPAGWEGWILREPGPTVFKRSTNLLKVKSFKDMELEVLDVRSGDMVMNGEDTTCAAALICDYQGERLPVGSGMDWAERLAFHKNPSSIVGKLITVKYFSESVDRHGKKSLIWPVFVGVRNEV